MVPRRLGGGGTPASPLRLGTSRVYLLLLLHVIVNAKAQPGNGGLQRISERTSWPNQAKTVVRMLKRSHLDTTDEGDSLDGLDKRGLFLRTSRDPAKSDYHGGQMRHVVRPLNNDLSWPEEKLSNGRRDKWGLYVRTLREPVRRHQGPGRGRQGVFLRASRGFNDVENQDWESLGESFLDQDEAEVGHAEQKKADRGLFLRTSKAPVAPYSIEDQAEQRSSMNVLDEEDQEGVDLEQPELDLDTLIAYLAQPAVSVPYMKKADNGLFLRTSRTLGVPWDDTVSMGMTDMDGEAEHPSPSKAKRGLLSRASRTSRHYDKKGDNGLFLRTSRTRGTPWVSGSKRGLFLRTS